MVLELKGEQLRKEGKKGSVLIDFYAPGCGPCKMVLPFLNEVKKEVGDVVKIIKVNIDEDSEFAKEFNVTSIPTLIAFKDGKETAKHVGFAVKPKIIELIETTK